MKTIVALLMLLLSVSASAAPAGWDKLLSTLRTEGEFSVEPWPQFAVKRFSAPRTGPHRADYLVADGYMEDGRFVPGVIRFIWEDWREQADKRTFLEIWHVYVSLDGELQKVEAHTQQRGAGDHRSNVYEITPIEVSKEAAAAKYAELLKFWSEAK